MFPPLVLVLLAAASSAPPVELQVCLKRLHVDPCADAGVRLEGTVHAWGLDGLAELSWSVDGEVRETVTAMLADGRASRHLVIFEPSGSLHEVVLQVGLGDLSARDGLKVSPPACPSALAVETVEVVPGQRVLVIVTNYGPGASGSWGIRAEVASALAYETVVDSLAPGRSYELLLGWDDVLSRAGGGRALIPLVVRLNPPDNDLYAGQPDYRVLLPRR